MTEIIMFGDGFWSFTDKHIAFSDNNGEIGVVHVFVYFEGINPHLIKNIRCVEGHN